MIVKTDLKQDTEYTNLMVKAYILKNINTEGYNMEPTPQNIIKIFKSEFSWNIERQGIRNAFIEWCKDVPSCLNLDIYYFDVNNRLENEFNALIYNEVTIYHNNTIKVEHRQLNDDNRQYNKYLNLIMINLFRMAGQKEELF
jgi:hypothetical protein